MSSEWVQQDSTWVFVLDGAITNYIRRSITAGQYVDRKGRILGHDVEAAKRHVEQLELRRDKYRQIQADRSREAKRKGKTE